MLSVQFQFSTCCNMKNFLPGPTEVNPEILAELAKPVMGHHTPEFRDLISQLKSRLQYIFGTENEVITLTCTASAALEAALVNTCKEKILVVSNGAFGERWLQAARSRGLASDGLVLGWGIPIPPYEVRRLLDRVPYDTVVMVHGESSTGMLNPIEPISELLKAHPEIVFIVDAVATLGGVELQMDKSRIDVLVGASHKCLALPPGVVPLGLSPRALKRSKSAKQKGYSFDFNLWAESWHENKVVGTPAVPQLQAMLTQLDRIQDESIQVRWKRHKNMQELTIHWAEKNGFIPFPPEDYRLPSVSCLRPEVSRATSPIVAALTERGFLIDSGYGKLKGRTIRIGHMGDWTTEDIKGLLDHLSQVST
ncbi:hypothetical protein CEE37_06145 [candidate division LCP-89 bacterium B3_LCP]|uniref:Aminotransferase class V domain-containing protein n=1 Tax=candidate division LCP-89 bacterium B3_LCP TaxID=2012998 RepID=A0A532V1Z1_UNCL8|nr:MAG: hypothetical protein CEE37_06145 [candidate division LCP-89 bacterium B3_LCP]